MQQQTAHLAGDERVKFFTGRLWGHLFGRTSGRRRPTAGHRAGRADGAPAEKRGGGVSRAVGAGELNCSANHGLTLMDTDRKSGGYGENFNVQYQISNIQFPSEQPKTKRLEVGRTLSGLSARGGVSRAVGVENFNIQCPISNFQSSRFTTPTALRLGRDASPDLSIHGVQFPAINHPPPTTNHQPSTTNQQPTTTAPNQFQLRTQRMTEE